MRTILFLMLAGECAIASFSRTLATADGLSKGLTLGVEKAGTG